MVLLGVYIALISISFFLIDIRSTYLLKLTGPGLKKFEDSLPADSRLFQIVEANKKRIRSIFLSYTFAFRLIYSITFLFGVIIIIIFT